MIDVCILNIIKLLNSSQHILFHLFKMSHDEDEELLQLLEQNYSGGSELAALKQEVSELRQRNAELEAELKQTFATVSAQSTIIRRYRATIGSVLGTTITTQKRSRSASSESSPPNKPAVQPPNPVKPPGQRKQIHSRLIADPEKKQTSDQVVCGGDVIQEKRIRLPTRDRSDGFQDISLATTIWNCIINFFETNADANLMDEHMIIKECGYSLLDDEAQPFLTHEKIQQYFTHSFTILETDLWMSVRPRFVNDKQIWIVFIPKWLKDKWCGSQR